MTTYSHKAAPYVDPEYPDDPPECHICGVPTVGERHHDEEEPPKRLPTLDAPIVAGTSNAMGDQAILRNVPKIGTLRSLVVEAVRARAMTDDELEVALSRTHQSVSATTNRLRADGWLTVLTNDAGAVTRKTRSGNDAQVWTLTPRASESFGDAPQLPI